MLIRKRRSRLCRIVVKDAAGGVLLDVGEADFALPEDVVIALSVRFFNDPEPCEIHRGAVRHRAVQELRERCPLNEAVAVSGLDAELWRLLPEGAATVLFSEADA